MRKAQEGIKQCDVLVIGGGGAGALAALEASKDERLKVMLVAKGPIGMSGLTPTANGGAAGAGSEDDLFKLMINTGRFLNHQGTAWVTTHEIKNACRRLQQLDVEVIPIRATSVCVHSTPALRKLRQHIMRRSNIELRETVLVTSLLTSGGVTSGATLLDLVTGEFFGVEAKAIVLATGGSTGELYPSTSNNPFGVTTEASGTGHGMAFLAGAELVDMEMIQFVPLPANPRCLNLRYFPEFWTGPYLNRLGDVVESNPAQYPAGSYSYELARILFREIKNGNGPIYIDKRSSPAIDAQLLIKPWEVRRRWIKQLGIDPRDNRIDIRLGSHFSMGGVRVNERTETTIPGLYAAGEIMGAVHGAVRIQGFSFSQMIVFGFHSGKHAADFALHRELSPVTESEVDEEREKIFRYLSPKKEFSSLGELKRRLQQVMERYAFVERSAGGLAEGLDQVRAIKDEIPRIIVPGFKRFNLEWARAIEFPLTVQTAELVFLSALAREESRGFHYRSDFPQEDNAARLRHTTVRLEDGRLAVGSTPVVFDYLRPET